ncbi:hypothetical protein V8F06_009215 [Rhypophila decipiens]
MTKRILLLCFLHGFKGSDDTFGDFPKHLEASVAESLPDDLVTSVVYPKYETRGELAQSTAAFLEWLKERVMELRKEHLEQPWPPYDRNVGVILVAHSMGGFVASDTLFRILDTRESDDATSSSSIIFPYIQGILAFDTPYNGLARSMFVYGAFSNYSKVSSVFNVMTALSAAAPATLSRLATKRVAGAATKRAFASASKSSPALKTWQLIAVRTGTVGAIAAGGVAAYMHRKEILEGVKSMRNLKKEDVVAGYQSSVDALGQGLAYVNRGNVGESFAWLSDHFTFVGCLLKQNELNRRLERLASLKGVGVKDFYTSLGENGVWSGGYFVPERTFCAVPTTVPTTVTKKDDKADKGEKDEKKGKSEKEQVDAGKLFERHVVEGAADEIVAHMDLFKRGNERGEYESMLAEASKLVIEWFETEEEILDDPKFREVTAEQVSEDKETEEIARAVDNGDVEEKEDVDESEKVKVAGTEEEDEHVAVPDESPIDIAAAASLVPLPDDDGLEDKDGKQSEQRAAYMRHLFGVAQQTGTNLRSYLPSKLPNVPEMPKGFSMPSVTGVSLPSMPSMPSLWGKKSEVSESQASKEEKAEEPGTKVDGNGDGAADETVKEPVSGAKGKIDTDSQVAVETKAKHDEGVAFLPLTGTQEDAAA